MFHQRGDVVVESIGGQGNAKEEGNTFKDALPFPGLFLPDLLPGQAVRFFSGLSALRLFLILSASFDPAPDSALVIAICEDG